jgi:hypothetical protein
MIDKPVLTLIEAAALWAGIEDEERILELIAGYRRNSGTWAIDYPELSKRFWYLYKAIENGQIKAFLRGERWRGVRQFCLDDEHEILDDSKQVVSASLNTSDLREWFEKHIKARPAFLFGEIDQNCSSKEPYLDRNHPKYAPELATAVKVWKFLYLEGGENKKQTHETNVLEWLDANPQDSDSGRFRKRIASMTQPGEGKKGGYQ